MDAVAAFAHTRRRITHLLREHGPSIATTRVPACPDWNVRDVAAHLAGVTADALAGNMEGAGTDPWTAVHVDTRSERSLDEILAEWDEAGPRLEAALAGVGPGANQLVFDTATHEHDLRQALDVRDDRDNDSIAVALEFITSAWAASFTAHGFEPLRLRFGDTSVDAGEGEPVATVSTTPFETLRALSGRRSLAQITAYDWDADPTLWLPSFTFGPFGPRDTDLVE